MSAALIGFCGCLKWGGVLIIGQGLPGSFNVLSSISKPLRLAWITFCKTYKIKAFPQVVIGPDYRTAAEALMLGAGLGGLSCNTVCIPLMKLDKAGRETVHFDKEKREQYVRRLMDALQHTPENADRTFGNEEYYNVPVRGSSEYCGVLGDVLRLDLNLIVACNYAKGFHQATTTLRQVPSYFVGITTPKPFTDGLCLDRSCVDLSTCSLDHWRFDGGG